MPQQSTHEKPFAISDGGTVEFNTDSILTLAEMLLDSTAKTIDKPIIYRLEHGDDCLLYTSDAADE